MIGLGDEFKMFSSSKENEGVQTKNMNKRDLYELLSEDYLLPACESKGVNREYLLKVHNDEVFRVKLAEYKLFEFGLEKSHNKKVGIINNSLLIKKLNMLLLEEGKKELGFTENELPNEAWLYKIARYIDRTGRLEFFESSPFPPEPLNEKSTLTQRIHQGRIYAGQWLFRLDAVKKNKKLFESFQSLAEKHKTLNSCKINCNVLEHEIEETKKKVIILEHEMNDLAGKLAFTYTSIENPDITPDLVIRGGDALTPEMRKRIQLNTQM